MFSGKNSIIDFVFLSAEAKKITKYVTHLTQDQSDRFVSFGIESTGRLDPRDIAFLDNIFPFVNNKYTYKRLFNI